MAYKDKAFCASKDCTNACGHKMTKEERKEVLDNSIPVSYGYFCSKPGENKNEL